MTTPIILVKQRHEAIRAGRHWDWRVVVGDKAYSWATKKDTPSVGKPLILWEQPVHDSAYALSKRVEIPTGQYGAGVTYLDYAQKGKADIRDGEYHLELNNGDRFLIKKMDPEKYGEKAWLFIRKKPVDNKNPYLEKSAAKKKEVITPGGEVLLGAGVAAGTEPARKSFVQSGKKLIVKDHKSYMAKANKAGKPFSKPYMDKMVQGAKRNAKLVDGVNLGAKAIRTGGGALAVGLIGHGVIRHLNKQASDAGRAVGAGAAVGIGSAIAVGGANRYKGANGIAPRTKQKIDNLASTVKTSTNRAEAALWNASEHPSSREFHMNNASKNLDEAGSALYKHNKLQALRGKAVQATKLKALGRVGLGVGVAAAGLGAAMKMKKQANVYLEKAAALGKTDFHAALERENRKRKEEGKPELDKNDKGLFTQFKQHRGVAGRAVGALVGTAVLPIPVVGTAAGYYIGKSIDNSNAGATFKPE